MIHHSNPVCDICGERHASGHTEECRDELIKMNSYAKDEIESLRRQLAAKDERIKGLVDALSDLLDEQNGPPLIGRAKQWDAAVLKAHKILEAAEAKGGA